MAVRVLSLGEKDGKKLNIFVEGDHDLHPEGGGQPGDSGAFFSANARGRVLNTCKNGDDCLLELKVEQGILRDGDVLDIKRDDARHDILSRMHSGEHVLSRVMENLRPGLTVYKVAIGEDRSAVYMRYDGEMDWDFLFEAEDRARKVINAALPVEILEMPIDEAKKLAGLKARWDRVNDATIRVIRIPDFDLIACSGSHVKNTSEIGTLCVESFKGNAPEWEISFSVENEKDLAYSRAMRRLISRFHCLPDEIGKMLERLGNENGKLKKQLSKIQQYVTLPWEIRRVDGVVFHVLSSSGLPRELVMSSSKKQAETNSDAVVLSLLDDGSCPAVPFVLCFGTDLSVDVKRLLGSKKLKIRGGGKGGILSGQTECRSLDTWLAACREVISGEVGG